LEGCSGPLTAEGSVDDHDMVFEEILRIARGRRKGRCRFTS